MKQQISECIRPGQHEWADVQATVISRSPRSVTIRLKAPFHGVNADYDAGSVITLQSDHYREV